MSTQSKLINKEMMEYLNSLPADVEIIDVSSFRVTQIPDLSRFTNARELRCIYNFNLTSIVSFPKTLTKIICNLNEKLTSLPALPDSLEELYCRGCLLTALPTLPNTLKVLDCGNNIKLTSLPSLPDTLQQLWCYHNKLTNLPRLPAALKLLQCSNNDLESLPSFPDTLEVLRVDNNKLASLPPLPPTLQSLDCSKNKLANIPPLPPSLQNVMCHHNQLWHFPPLVNNIDLYCRNNPIYERIGHITDMTNVSEYEYTYTNIEKFKKLTRFQELYHTLKYKRKFRQWLLRTKEKEIMAKYKPENLFALLERENDEGYQIALDVW